MREAKQVDLMNHSHRLVGLEFENPLVKKDGQIIDSEDLANFWQDFIHPESGDEEETNYINGKVTGVSKRLASGEMEGLNTDTGICTLEMSLSPRQNLMEAEQVFQEVSKEVLKTTKKLNLKMLGYAIQPRKIVGDPSNYKTDKSLYLAFKHLTRHNSQIPNTAHQVGVSLRFEEALKAINTLQAISGAITCLTANSPIFEDQISPWKETRLISWRLMSTCGRVPEEMRLFSKFPDQPFSSLAEYFKYMWAGPMVIPVLRNGQWVRPNKEMSYLEFLRSKSVESTDLLGNKMLITPEVADLNLATICIWIDAKLHLTFNNKMVTVKDFLKALDEDRLEKYLDKSKLLNCYMEYRIGGSAPVGEEMALPAFALGLINNLPKVTGLMQRYTWKQWQELRENCYILAMQSKLAGQPIVPILSEMLAIAEEGLLERVMGEEKYLKPLYKRIKTQSTPADQAIIIFKKKGMAGFLESVSY